MAQPSILLNPVFDFVEDQREYTLRTGDVEITVNGNRYQGTGRAVLQIMPTPCILFKAEIDDVPRKVIFASHSSPQQMTSFIFDGKQIDGFSGGLGFDSLADKTRCKVTWHPSAEPVYGVGDDNSEITRLVFHLFNFHNFAVRDGTSETRDGTTVAINQLALRSSHVVLTIKSLYESHDIQQQIREEGAYRITHVGLIQHADGSCMNGSQANKHLSDVLRILTFTNGKRTIPVCACGYSTDGARVWEQWASPKGTTRRLSTWFDTYHCDQLRTFFDCYSQTACNELWGKALHEAIYWYVNALDDRRGIDAGIILAQAALELLSYTYVVRDKTLLLAKSFKDLKASDKMRLLFGSIGIPITIPAECADIHALIASRTNQLQWLDLPHALSEVRNAIVHPDASNRDVLSPAYYDAWRAFLWCLELTILRLCNYHGTYSNRLAPRSAGTVEVVPWDTIG